MNILIVESAAKARTLQKYLGEGWKVMETGGHVETLPDDRKRHGKDARKAYWANKPGELPRAPWVFTDRGEKKLRGIIEVAEAAGDEDVTFWVATDPDREGEFIAWCLERILEPYGTIHRVSFQEVTKEAVEEALANPGSVDSDMVDSALVRKFLDRLVGFRASKTARKVVPGSGGSMGRVQTPTLGFVVERELEREAHEPIEYFEVRARTGGVELKVVFHDADDTEAWRDDDGRVVPTRTFHEDAATEALAALEAAREVSIESLKESTRRRRSAAPLSTDALLQRAGSRLGWSPRKTSVLASMLYEAGHITYIRTDSTRLAASAVKQARAVVKEAFGEDHLGSEARTDVVQGPTQDAHEAIRPTDLGLEEVGVDDADARKLYRLIRAHTLASQMAPSVRTIVSVEAACADFPRPLRGSVSWRTFAGWEAAYGEFLGPVATAPPDLPLQEGSVWTLDPDTDEEPNPELVQDETRPPPRYRPHTLIRAMKEAGIGRPSTYSRTVEKLEERRYVELEEGALVPTERGRDVWIEVAPLYAEDGEGEGRVVELFSPEFTAQMEERLDRIAAGSVPAPPAWEEWRDQVRDLHEVARKRRDSGEITPKRKERLERLLANPAASDVISDPEALRPLSKLTEAQARELERELREAGLEPVETERQRAYMEQLVTDLDLEENELEELIGVRSLDAISTSVEASEAINALKEAHKERTPPSQKQLRYIESLIEDADISEEEAAELADTGSLDELTGGPDGSASALIDALKRRVEEG